MFNSFDISVSGMVANRIWHDTIAANIANLNTTRDELGRPNPYQRRFPVMTPAENGSGVQVTGVESDNNFRLKFDPGNPDAQGPGPLQGWVKTPAIDLYTELTNSMVAQRSYEANLTALQATKQMISSDLRILG